jgi:hypothetical protein
VEDSACEVDDNHGSDRGDDGDSADESECDSEDDHGGERGDWLDFIRVEEDEEEFEDEMDQEEEVAKLMAATWMDKLKEEELVAFDSGTSHVSVVDMKEDEKAREIKVQLAAGSSRAKVNVFEEVMVMGRAGKKLMSVGRVMQDFEG